MKFNKKSMLIILMLIIVIVTIIIVVVSNKDVDDEKRFSEEYTSVPINNRFKYASIDEVLDIVKNDSAVIYLGYSECIYYQDYAKYLNEVIYDTKVDIYYLNVYKDRKKDTKKYHELLELLDEFLPYNEVHERQILVPASIYVSDGKIIYYNDETSYVTRDMEDTKSYWTVDRINQFKNNILPYIEQIEENNE